MLSACWDYDNHIYYIGTIYDFESFEEKLEKFKDWEKE